MDRASPTQNPTEHTARKGLLKLKNPMASFENKWMLPNA